ncbi:MAG TPA: ABC transporter substrate-binding protein [Candidatus Acidoferrales bacterium]|nr:ABC transporter substrate-binding protein [Candidatus Acidoferrales bacterium]
MRIATAFLILVVAGSAYAQIPFRQPDETNYNLGLQSYKQGDYSTAYQYFRQVINDSMNQRSAEAFYYGSKSLFSLHRYQEAISTIDTFLARFPGDEHKYEMMYILGADYYSLGKYQSAGAQFVVAIDSAGDQMVKDRAVASLRTLVTFNLSFDDIRNLFAQCRTRVSALTIAIPFARRAYFSDRVAVADSLLREFMQRYPESGTGSGEISKWLDRISADKDLSQASTKIGALLPLQYGGSVGDRLLLGIQLALDDYNAAAQTKVGLVLENYGSNLVTLYSDMRSLAKNDAVKAIIGPVFSNEVSTIEDIANSSKVPTITPTATQTGLVAGNTYMFQANPNFKTRARAMADYAVNVLHIQKISVLSPSDTYGKTIAGFFVARLNELNVKPISVEYFETGTTDLSKEMEKIKSDAAALGEPYIDFATLNKDQQAILKSYGIASSFVDSLDKSRGIVDAYDLLGDNPQKVADSIKIPITSRTVLGDFEALRSLGAIFIPLTSSKDIGVVGAQIAYYNVRAQLIGTDDWYDLNQLSNNDLYDDGVIFCSDTYFDTNSPAYKAASDTLSRISDIDFDRTISYGYDLTNALLDVMKTKTDRPDIENALKSETYHGLHSTISFSSDNSNHYIHILQFKKGSIIDLGEVNAN